MVLFVATLDVKAARLAAPRADEGPANEGPTDYSTRTRNAELGLTNSKPAARPADEEIEIMCPERSLRFSLKLCWEGAGYLRYCSSLTFSIQSTTFSSSASWMAMCVMAVVGAAPCQCFTPGG